MKEKNIKEITEIMDALIRDKEESVKTALVISRDRLLPVYHTGELIDSTTIRETFQHIAAILSLPTNLLATHEIPEGIVVESVTKKLVVISAGSKMLLAFVMRRYKDHSFIISDETYKAIQKIAQLTKEENGERLVGV